MKSIKQIEQDKRVYCVERIYDSDSAKYLLWVEDGWLIDDCGVAPANSVAELNELLNQIEEDKG